MEEHDLPSVSRKEARRYLRKNREAILSTGIIPPDERPRTIHFYSWCKLDLEFVLHIELR